MKKLIIISSLFISACTNRGNLPAAKEVQNGTYKAEFIGVILSGTGKQEVYKITIDSNVVLLSTCDSGSSMVKLK
jgi:hypothetical protein